MKPTDYPTDLNIFMPMADLLLSYVSKNGTFEDEGYDHTKLLSVEYPITEYALIEHARLNVS